MRIGVDLGGTKIEAVVMDEGSSLVVRQRVATPQGDYGGTLEAIAGVVRRLEAAVAWQNLPVGVGHPSAISPSTGLLKNSNSTCLNGRRFQQDLEAVLGHEVYLANDADCLALSEARDGAAAGAANVFAVILGTGVGGGIAIGGRLLRGPNAIAGEWGHNPLPGSGRNGGALDVRWLSDAPGATARICRSHLFGRPYSRAELWRQAVRQGGLAGGREPHQPRDRWRRGWIPGHRNAAPQQQRAIAPGRRACYPPRPAASLSWSRYDFA